MMDKTLYDKLRRKDPIVFDSIRELVESKHEYDYIRGKSFLISGGAGFLGSWLVDTLYILGAEKITIIDNMSTGDESNISHLLETSTVQLIKKPVESFKPTKGYDYIIHMAARPSPDDYVKNPIETLRVSSEGTYIMLETARLNDAIFLFTSTSEIYGHADKFPINEDYWGYVNPVGPRSCYDEGKRYAEALTMAYYNQYGLDIRISRIFNTYGPRLDWKISGYGRVITKFIVQGLKGDPITVHGSGNQTRSFLYVSDNIEAHLKLLKPNNILKGQIVNIGSDHEIKIIELAKLIKELTGSVSKIVHTDPRPEDPPRRLPDISKARQLLNWNPRTDLKEGILYSIEWIKTRLKYS